MEDELRETHFAALIVGTGLTQSITAAALAAIGIPIIHIDEHASYGGPHASLALSDLADRGLSPGSEPTAEVLARSRQYALSLAPHLIPATGPFVAALVNSGVARYGSFALPKRVAMAVGDADARSFKSVPSSKQDVFRDRDVSLVQKRRLIKFLMFASGDFEGSAELGGHEQIPLLQFLQDKFSLATDLADALAYAIAFCTSPHDPTLPALIRTRNYLRSVGRYGSSPFLIGHYGGAGELAQGFCRTCAVRGGTYVLGRKVLSITRADGPEEPREASEATHPTHITTSGAQISSYHPPSTFESYGTEGIDIPPSTEEPPPSANPDVAPSSAPPTSPLFRIQLEGFAAPFTASTIVGSEDWLRRVLDNPQPGPQEPKYTKTVRGILVINSPQTFALDTGANEQPSADPDADADLDADSTGDGPVLPRLDETLLVFPPSSGLGSDGVVTVLANGSATMSCPDEKCILYFTGQTASLEASPKNHLAPYVKAVLDSCTPRPSVHFELFYREQEVARISVRKAGATAIPEGTREPEYTSMHLTEGADAAVQEAERAFWEVVEKKPGEGVEGVEFFARVAGEDEGLDDF
ncbi:Rab proteins geranylgeranyltransferase component A [Ceratobasidium sp. 395]|nr:Rab proteins geranylgeranyltransferase component A [Ceratobasidium sp. 395]